MDAVVELIFLSVLYLVSLGIYGYLIMHTLPTRLSPIVYDTNAHLGRGLKKVTYPNGRAVLYETNHSIRKYMSQYLLFTLDGYKYMQMQISDRVKQYTATVISYDSENKVIDILEISEVSGNFFSQPLRLHHKTSYIAYILTSVNGNRLPNKYMKVRLSWAPYYILAATIATFLHFVHLIVTVDKFLVLIKAEIVLNLSFSFFILPSLAIGIGCFIATQIARICKGVKVVLK